MHPVILVGGRGTQLRRYTTTFPKPLMGIADMPLLDVSRLDDHEQAIAEFEAAFTKTISARYAFAAPARQAPTVID